MTQWAGRRPSPLLRLLAANVLHNPLLLVLLHLLPALLAANGPLVGLRQVTSVTRLLLPFTLPLLLRLLLVL